MEGKPSGQTCTSGTEFSRRAYRESFLKKGGTLYSVELERDDHEYLKGSLEDLIVDVFSPALAKGLNISVNREAIKPWNPEHEFKKSLKVRVADKIFPVVLRIAKNDIPSRMQNVQYHVTGKIITTKKPDWARDVKPRYQKRVHVYVDATAASKHLDLTKTGFKQGHTNRAFKEVDRRVLDVLKKQGYMEVGTIERWERTRLTRFFEKLFKDPEYAFLNPEARGGGSSPGQDPTSGGGQHRGSGSSGGGGSSPGQDPTSGGGQHRGSGSSGGGGNRSRGTFSMGFAERPDNAKEGWLDHATNKVVINLDHPLFIKYENNAQARNQRIGSIITTVLITNATAKKSDEPY